MRDKKTRCYNGGDQHNFQPRYSERERILSAGCSITSSDLAELRNFLTLKVYERDVCVWCGKTIEKEKQK